MSEEALAKAREIAARLAGILNLNTELYIAYNLQFFTGGIGGGSDLGKRKNRWEDDDGNQQPSNLSPSAVAASVTSNQHFQNLAMSLGISGTPGCKCNLFIFSIHEL